MFMLLQFVISLTCKSNSDRRYERISTTYPRSGEMTYDWQLGQCNQVMIDSYAWIKVHQFLLHWLYIEHRMMFHVATSQLVFLRNLLLTWHTWRVAQTVRTLGDLFILNHILLSGVTKLSKSYTNKIVQICARMSCCFTLYFTTALYGMFSGSGWNWRRFAFWTPFGA